MASVLTLGALFTVSSVKIKATSYEQGNVNNLSDQMRKIKNSYQFTRSLCESVAQDFFSASEMSNNYQKLYKEIIGR